MTVSCSGSKVRSARKGVIVIPHTTTRSHPGTLQRGANVRTRVRGEDMTLRIKNAGDPLRESNIVEVLTATKMKPEPGTTLRGFYRLLPRLVGAFDQGGIWGIGNRE